MRIFSILAALAVTLLLAMSILARPQLVALLGGDETRTEQETTEQVSETPSVVEQDPDTLVKVQVRKLTGRQVDSAVILRGETEAARQVDVKSETSAVIVSDPLRKGAHVEEGDALCVLDPGTRQAALDEARARLSEAESRVPEGEARLAEAKARLDEAEIRLGEKSRIVNMFKEPVIQCFRLK